ncbi:DNA cross-link repair 1A protein [Pangasianodon hypophthalmus]|uniref:DNA cross-link repair 1A protein n=1 Tax=Pangasianodon hypophthalmus TaxID=310915 RepID=UPI0023076B03|nr:DNA cross-link repair 1A protein [Pangasianodon hypophthalmus]
MSQSESESDIWEYKSLKKTKRQDKTPKSSEDGSKRRRLAKQGASKKKSDKSCRGGRLSTEPKTATKLCTQSQPVQVTNADGPLTKSSLPSGSQSAEVHDGPSDQSRGYCPVCQMPFSILVVQTAQWHVAECLENPGETSKECPDGLQCSSSIPNHYKWYSHSLLAHSRALNATESASSILGHTPRFHLEQKTFHNDTIIYSKDSVVDSAVNLSTASSQSAFPAHGSRESLTPVRPNAFQLLRSPGPEDIKKKKGWSPSTKGPRSHTSTQEAKIRMSTPVKAGNVSHDVQTREVKEEPCTLDDDDDYISYSPLSELPAETEEKQIKKKLFHSTALEEVNEKDDHSDSLILFNDSALSGDDLFADVLDQYETERVRSPGDPVIKESLYTCDQLESLESHEHLTSSSCAGPTDRPLQSSSPFRHSKDVHVKKEREDNPQLPSPQNLVLERLRECISTAAKFESLNSTCVDVKSDSLNQEMSSTQTILATRKQTLSLTPKKSQTKAGASGLKQTDIGVFFGLKPLKEKREEVSTTVEEKVQVSSASGKSSGAAERQTRRRKNTAVSEVTTMREEAGEGAAQPTQTEGSRGARAWGRKRWNKTRATDGEAEEPKRCPFYKKIPGTSFAVDAFQYGNIKGITAYFLTHFHSDHYGGLKKTSTFPIYCNKITGNLVKSKLHVDEQYIHTLPMNEECVVDGVKVILLDANHCPGSAMLLLLLPDGQTVLHTGDFRAHPSMERYPELQGVRIQTLYLDTTYCSPEYAFPTQQEVITFAANTAFELVTLNPRTLIVCGTYSVGKEKVFLAISQVLDSKVYMSKDRYKTMCCLESEHIYQCITTDMKAARIHVLPMMQINFKNLKTYLNKFSGTYDQLVAFKPTGWTFSQEVGVAHIQPQVKDNISIYGIPYSEHSSYLELKRFVQWLRPLKIIPTVNVGSWSSRKAMTNCFSEWQAEVKALNVGPRSDHKKGSCTR